jgi:hypothetical protein
MNINGPLIAVIVSFIIGNNNLILAHLQVQIDKLDIVVTFLTNKLDNGSGKGHVAYGGVPRPPAIEPMGPTLTHMRHQLNHDRKCFSILGLTPHEFSYISRYLIPEVRNRRAQALNGRKQRPTKPGAIWPELYLLFRYLRDGPTFKNLDSEFCWASSAIPENLQSVGNFYLGLLRRLSLVQWPSLPEIKTLIQLAPTCFLYRGYYKNLPQRFN